MCVPMQFCIVSRIYIMCVCCRAQQKWHRTSASFLDMTSRLQAAQGACGSQCKKKNKECSRQITWFRFTHLRHRKVNVYGNQIISRTGAFICWSPDNCSGTHPRLHTSYFKTTRQNHCRSNSNSSDCRCSGWRQGSLEPQLPSPRCESTKTKRDPCTKGEVFFAGIEHDQREWEELDPIL